MNDVTRLGDCHLGREFKEGVLPEKRGIREAMVWAEFEASIMDCNTKLHIQVGDLFNSFDPENQIIKATADAYKAAASKNPDTIYVIIRGNHDGSRDIGVVSGFDLFADMVEHVPNIKVLKDPHIIAVNGKMYGFIPWSPFKSSTQLASEFVKEYYGATYFDEIYGHWETESFGGTDENLVPTKLLKPITDVIYTGHIHTPTKFVRDGVEVIAIGSMQPYSHAEDPEGRFYITLTVAEINTFPSDYFTHKHVRVILGDDEEMPVVDCLSLTMKRKPKEEVERIEVEFDEFDMTKLFQASLTEFQVGTGVQEKVLAKFKEMRHVE